MEEPGRLAHPKLRAPRLAPHAFELVRGGTLEVWVPGPEPEQAGEDSIEAALAQLEERLGPGARRYAWKVLSAEGARDRIRAEVLGALSTSRVEIHAAWQLAWSRGFDGDYQLAQVELLAYREVRRSEPQPLFTEATADLLRGENAYGAQLSYGIDHWRRRIDASLGVSTLGHQGISVADVDGDRVEELYVLQPGGLPNLLLTRTPDGRAVDRAEEWGLDFLDPSRSALFADLDGDGDQDLVLALFSKLLVLENEGSRFKIRTGLPAPTATSLAGRGLRP